MEKKLHVLALLVMLAATSATVFGAGYNCATCSGSNVMMYEDDSCEDGSCEDDIVIDDIE